MDAPKSRDDLIAHIFELTRSYDSERNDWANRDIGMFLHAMAAWLKDSKGYYQKTDQVLDVEKPSWQLFADALSAAAVYE